MAKNPILTPTLCLQGCQNVAEQNSTKGVPAPSARPTAVLRCPEAVLATAGAHTVCYATVFCLIFDCPLLWMAKDNSYFINQFLIFYFTLSDCDRLGESISAN
jgi:hypothetical protein